MTAENLEYKPGVAEKDKLEYSSLGKDCNKGLGKEDKKEGLFKKLKNVKGKKEEQLKKIKDQWEKQLKAIKNQGEKQLKLLESNANSANTKVFQSSKFLNRLNTEPKKHWLYKECLCAFKRNSLQF